MSTVIFKTKPFAIRFSNAGSRYKDHVNDSLHFQITLAQEVRQRFGITVENVDTKRIVFVLKDDGKVEVECLHDQPKRKKWRHGQSDGAGEQSLAGDAAGASHK